MSKTKSTSISTLKKEAIKELDELAKKRADLANESKKVAEKAVDLLKEMIQSSPYIEAIRWQQYTPYFNDGDSCEFGVHDVEFKFSEEITGAGDKAGDGDSYSDDNDNFVNFSYNADIKEFFDDKKDVINFKNIDELQALVDSIIAIQSRLASESSALEDAFGNHTTVIVSKTGITTEEYEHD